MDETTPYQAELVGIELAVANAITTSPQDTNLFWFFTNNQTLIRDLTETARIKPGMAARARIRRLLRQLINRRPDAKAAMIWCPSKKDIQSMSRVDEAAKKAALLPQRLPLQPNPTSVRKKIKDQLREAALVPPSSEMLRRLMNTFNPADTFKALCKLPRPDATLVAKLCSGHCPLNAYLHRLKVVDSPNCDLCQQVETVDHFLTSCRKFAGLRRRLFNKARLKSTAPNHSQLLKNPKLFKAVADYGRQTFRF